MTYDPDATVLSVVPFSLRRDGRVWLGSWLRAPVMPRVLRRVPVGLHQHGVSVREDETDAWALVSVDAE